MKGGVILVRSAEQLKQILKLGNKIYLRKNIEQVEITDEMTDETRQEWQADEVMFKLGELSDKPTVIEIENNFDLYYNWADEKRQRERVEKEKAGQVKKMIEEEYTLADLKAVVDTLVLENLGV